MKNLLEMPHLHKNSNKLQRNPIFVGDSKKVLLFILSDVCGRPNAYGHA
jgi:hypothetical protein